MSGLGEQTIGNGWSCAKLDVSLMGSNRCALQAPTRRKCRQLLLELARRSVWFLFFESDCFKHKLALVCEDTV